MENFGYILLTSSLLFLSEICHDQIFFFLTELQSSGVLHSSMENWSMPNPCMRYTQKQIMYSLVIVF